MGTITRKKTLVSLVCALALVMMMSTCALADTTFGNDNDVYSYVESNNLYSQWSGFFTDYTYDDDCLDIDQGALIVGVDVATLEAYDNSGIIVQDSAFVSVVDISDIAFTLDVALTDSFNEGSYNLNYSEISNVTWTNVGNETWTNVDNNNEFLCDNELDIVVTNVGNDYSQQNVGNDNDCLDLDVSDVLNDTNSYNDVCSDNDYQFDATYNYGSYNSYCDGNGNLIPIVVF